MKYKLDSKKYRKSDVEKSQTLQTKWLARLHRSTSQKDYLKVVWKTSDIINTCFICTESKTPFFSFR